MKGLLTEDQLLERDLPIPTKHSVKRKSTEPKAPAGPGVGEGAVASKSAGGGGKGAAASKSAGGGGKGAATMSTLMSGTGIARI